MKLIHFIITPFLICAEIEEHPASARLLEKGKLEIPTLEPCTPSREEVHIHEDENSSVSNP